MDSAKLNLLPNERLESFWDGLWLGIRTFLCFMLQKLCVWLMDSAKLNLLQNERLESFWDGLWLGIQRFLCFMLQKLCVSLKDSLQNSICYKMSISRASRTSCGSSYGRFCFSLYDSASNALVGVKIDKF